MTSRLQKPIALLATSLALTTPVHAEDIDIYTTGSTEFDAPNVLFFFDNTSNWTANNQRWIKGEVFANCGGDTECQRYVELVFGENSPDTTTLEQGQVQLRATRAVLKELICDVPEADRAFNINIGLMLFADAKGTPDGSSVSPGYIRRAIKGPDDFCAESNSLVSDLLQIDQKINDPDFKTSGAAAYGTALYDAFKYYGGHAATNGTEALIGGDPVGPTGFGPAPYGYVTDNAFADPDAFTDDTRSAYQSPIAEGFCGQNFIILVGNGWPSQEERTNQNASPPTNELMTRLGLTPQQLYETSKSDIRFADEWASFLARTDVSPVAGHQPVKTFTIDVFNTLQGGNRPKQAQLLSSMAQHGGTGSSGYFTVGGNLGDLVEALKRIFMQIASVNSAYASASLPISVNTQGTYLNQVYIGMFRPKLEPRWEGNLKQYHVQLDAAGGLYLADANDTPAVDNVVTGFILDCAQSFWTDDSANYWQSVPGAPVGQCLSMPNREYSDSPDGPIVERGGVAQGIRSLTSASDRTVHTCAAPPAQCNSIETFSDSDTLARWIRGENVGDCTGGTSCSEQYGKPASGIRPTVHGGVVHSRPLALSYGADEDVVVFYGADDGMLRAIDGRKSAAGGGEVWAFLAPEFRNRLERLRNNSPHVQYFNNPNDSAPKDYFFDGTIGAYIGPDADSDALVRYIYPSMRRGGRVVYAFDVTANPRFSTPLPMWRFGCEPDGSNCVGGADAAKLGQTWSAPRVIRTRMPEPEPSTAMVTRLYTVFGGGYDRCEDDAPRSCDGTSLGRGIFVLDAKTGNLARYIDLGSAAGRVVADVVAVDTTNDGFHDLIYAVDTSGNLWRLNISDLAPSDWVLTRVAGVGDWSDSNERNRKFLTAPSVVKLGSYNVVLAGTGDREKPLASQEAAGIKNRFYGFWDFHATTGNAFDLINDSSDCDDPGDLDLDAGCQVMNTTDPSLDYNPVFASALTRPRGWVIDLDMTTGPREQVVTQPAVIGGLVFFNTFQATAPNASGGQCGALGNARGYHACFLHGGSLCELPQGTTVDRSTAFAGGGIPPSPVAGVVALDDGLRVPFCVGCRGVGVEGAVGGSPLEVGRVEIPVPLNRIKEYRYRIVDE